MRAGSELVITHTLPSRLSRVQALYSTLHLQASNMAVSPGSSTAYLYQAADCSSSTRPLFDFPLRRRDHGQSFTWDTLIVSGGLSGQGGAVSNDWLRYESQTCLSPSDPSYWPTLGRGRVVPPIRQHVMGLAEWDASLSAPSFSEALWLFTPGDKLLFQCEDGLRFQPPQRELTVELSCLADSLWYDLSFGGIRRCVPAAVSCDWPMVVSGLDECRLPTPSVQSLRVLSVWNFGTGPQPSVDRESVLGLPIHPVNMHRTRQLFITGQWLRPPVSVTVGNRPCMDAQLSDSVPYCSGRHNLGGNGGTALLSCGLLSSRLSCTLSDGRAAKGSVVELRVGEPAYFITTGGEPTTEHVLDGFPDFSALYTGHEYPLTVSTERPSVSSLYSDDCSSASRQAGAAPELQLCPNSRVSSIVVCFDSLDYDGQMANPALPRPLLDGARLSCPLSTMDGLVQRLDGNQTACHPRLPRLLCEQPTLCMQCSLPPGQLRASPAASSSLSVSVSHRSAVRLSALQAWARVIA